MDVIWLTLFWYLPYISIELICCYCLKQRGINRFKGLTTCFMLTPQDLVWEMAEPKPLTHEEVELICKEPAPETKVLKVV